MIFDKEGNITTVFQENISLSTFIKNLNNGYKNIKGDHLIINLFSFSELGANDLLEFLELSEKHRKVDKSFVLVSDKIDYENVPEKITLAPTIKEAKDIIDLEEIERDLDLFE